MSRVKCRWTTSQKGLSWFGRLGTATANENCNKQSEAAAAQRLARCVLVYKRSPVWTAPGPRLCVFMHFSTFTFFRVRLLSIVCIVVCVCIYPTLAARRGGGGGLGPELLKSISSLVRETKSTRRNRFRILAQGSFLLHPKRRNEARGYFTYIWKLRNRPLECPLFWWLISLRGG